MTKPTLNALEACHRPALSEGQKENEKRERRNRMKRKIVSTALLLLLLLTMLSSLPLVPLVSAAYTVQDHYMPFEPGDSEPVCALKTYGCFYVPNATISSLQVVMLFNDSGLVGDQTGKNVTGYPFQFPDGKVDLSDLVLLAKAYGTSEGQSGWNYMADIAPPWRNITLADLVTMGNNYGHTGTYINITDFSNVTVTFDTGQQISPDSGGFVVIPQGATSFNVAYYGNPIGAMIIFHAPPKAPIAYSTDFNFTVPNDGDNEVWYYVMARFYVPPELSGQDFYFVANADDRVQNVKVDSYSKAGSGSSVNIDLGKLCGNCYHLLEFEFVEIWGGGWLNFNVTTASGNYARLTRFRVYVPNYSDNEVEYTVRTHTYFPGDDFFLGGYADDLIEHVYLDAGLLWQDWEWWDGGTIFAWGDGFMYPLGWQYDWHNITFNFKEIWAAGMLDFQYISRTSQSAKIGPPKFYASAKINNLGTDITLNNAYIDGGSQWAGNPGVSARNATLLTTYDVMYNDGGTWFDTLLAVEVGNWWATWELGGSQPPDVAIPLNFTVVKITSNLPSGGLPPPFGIARFWDVDLNDYTIDIYSFQHLPIKGIEEAGAGQSHNIIAPDYTIGLNFVGDTIMTASAFFTASSVPYIGATVGLGVQGITAVLGYLQGQQVSRYSQTIQGDNHWQLTANEPILLYPDTNSSSSKSQSDLVFLKFQPNSGYSCGLTKVVLKGTLDVGYNYITGGWPIRYDYPIGNIEITLCIPWFIWSQT
jgi:hypothetical protein